MDKKAIEDLTEHKLFVPLSEDYNKIVMGQAMNISNNEIQVLWLSNTGKLRGLEKYPLDKFIKEFIPFLNIDRQNREFKNNLHEELKNKVKKWYKVVNQIYLSNQYRLEINQCISVISENLNVTPILAESILKLKIAQNQLIYKQLRSGNFVSLNGNILRIEHKKRYLSSLSSEIQSLSNRIDFIIGHGQTVGNYREKLFISILRKYIPRKFHVATGFIEGVNKQIDIIIYDHHNYIPVFREDDLVVVKIESVMAVIEIKSTLDNNTLENSLYGISSIEDSWACSVPFFKGVFAFKSNFTNDKTLAENVLTFYKNNPIDGLHQHFDVICVPNKHCLHIKYTKNNQDFFIPQLVSLESNKDINIEESFFFKKLFDHIESEQSSKKVNREYFKELRATAKASVHGDITEKDWIPLYSFLSEWKYLNDLDLEKNYNQIFEISKSNVGKRLLSIINWKNGTISRQELINLYNMDR